MVNTEIKVEIDGLEKLEKKIMRLNEITAEATSLVDDIKSTVVSVRSKVMPQIKNNAVFETRMPVFGFNGYCDDIACEDLLKRVIELLARDGEQKEG